MKFLDFTTLLETEAADLAVLSTFQFDPDFFERRLLRSPALAKARRILVFMDASQWFNLLKQDVPARLLNRRYLVVPVRPPKGVFHPKLNLLVRADGGLVQCGSNNLTRSGCASNLELLNSFTFTLAEEDEEAIRLAQEAYAFFKQACNDAEVETGRIARQWLEESAKSALWLETALPANSDRMLRLVHTYDGSLWDRLSQLLESAPPKRFLVISPFFDKDAGLLYRFRQRWPKCQYEIVVQQQTTALPIAPVKKLGGKVALSELRNSTRRLHAKLLAWESPLGVGCLVGSANFTTAAFDARNVEACLLISNAGSLLSSLFDTQLTKRMLAFDDFEPGFDQEPEAEDVDVTTLRLTSALLNNLGELKVSYRHQMSTKPSSLRLAIRIAGEKRPRVLLDVPNKERGATKLTLSEGALQDAHGTILASLIAEIGDKREESPAIWIIQEARLTYEPSAGGASSANSKIEESGEGLAEFLEEIGSRDGVAAVIEYLRRLNIRFHDGEGRSNGGRLFRLRVRDPFRSDDAPDWLLRARSETISLTEAIYDFVDRHEKQRLRRHAKHGNINGMENFLDIFTTLVRILYVYHVRGFVHRHQLVGRLTKYVAIAIYGIDSDDDYCDGYLTSVSRNLADTEYLQDICRELNFMGHVRAAFLIAQKVRYIPGDLQSVGTAPKRPREYLPERRVRLQEGIRQLGLTEPSRDETMQALSEYKMFTAAELASLEKEIVF